MAQTQQGKKHASFRAISGTSGTFNGDAMAAMAVELTAAGRNVPATFNGRMIAWLKLRTGSTDSNINQLMVRFAKQHGARNWDRLGEFPPMEA